MATHEMDASNSPLLFRFPTTQPKPFRSPSASTSSQPAMNGADLSGNTNVHQSAERDDTTQPILAPIDMTFDAMLDPSMLHVGFLASSFSAPSQLPQHQLFLPSNQHQSVIFGSHQLQSNQLNCPRSMPNTNSAHTLSTSNNSQHSQGYYLTPDTLQPRMEFATPRSPYSIDELQTHHGEAMESIEGYRAVEQDEFCNDRMTQDSMFRYSATPFGGSDDGSPREDYPLDRDEPYAQRIFRCLKEAPNHTMILKDIYKWFKDNTDKGQDPNVKGWQNSIRHNLSMNKAFNKIELPPEKDQKRRYVWQLSEQALREGVQSTTRFRNKQPNKRGAKSHTPSQSRVASGQKGGEAARKAASLRRSERLNEARMLERTRSGLPPRVNYSHTSATPSTTTSSPTVRPNDAESFFGPPSQHSEDDLQRALTALGVQYGAPAGNIPIQNFSNSSYPNSPVFSDQTEVHFPPPYDTIFSDSPDSSSEPHTPSTFAGDMPVDQFFSGLPSDGMMF